MPWLNYEDFTICKRFFEDVVFENHLPRFDVLSKSSWFFIFYGFFRNRDLRRSIWVWRYLLNNSSSHLDSTITSSPFTISMMIRFCTTASKRNWRFPAFNEQAIRELEKRQFLCHPYKDVREEVAKYATHFFVYKIKFCLIYI